jgi:GTPase
MKNQNNLIPEVEEGNIEYKRYLINLEPSRIEQLTTQMLWRLSEGDGEAIYYLGIEDDGKPYKMTDDMKRESFKNLNQMIEKSNAEITKIDTIKNDDIVYFKITINKKEIILPEIRVILLGESGSGKTTFLSNILMNKIETENSESRMFLLNHKHELVNKKTSSINCHNYKYNNNMFSFIEAPGFDKYKKTKYKSLLTIKPNFCLLFTKNSDSNKVLSDKYLIEKIGIPYLEINIFTPLEDSVYNCKKLINKESLLSHIIQNAIIQNDDIVNKLSSPFNETKFNILNIYPTNDSGILVSGFLVSGKLEINKSINIFSKNKDSSFSSKRCYIKSIYANSRPIKQMVYPRLLTVCLKTNFSVRKTKMLKKYLFLSNKKPVIQNKIFFKVNSNSIDTFNNNNKIGYCENKKVYLENIKHMNDNIYQADIKNYYIGDSFIIIDNESIAFLE